MARYTRLQTGEVWDHFLNRLLTKAETVKLGPAVNDNTETPPAGTARVGSAIFYAVLAMLALVMFASAMWTGCERAREVEASQQENRVMTPRSIAQARAAGL